MKTGWTRTPLSIRTSVYISAAVSNKLSLQIDILTVIESDILQKARFSVRSRSDSYRHQSKTDGSR
jgi:hypothetical protein